MNPRTPLHLLPARDRAALADAARHRAQQLRTEAEQAFFNAIARSVGRLARRGWAALHGSRNASAARC